MTSVAPDLRTLVTEITKWAETKRMFGDARLDTGFDEVMIRDAFSGVGLQAATKILQDRHIAYLGINEAENSIQIFTQKGLRIRDRDLLEKARLGDIRLVFRNGSQLSSGNIPPISSPVPPYHLHNQHYTCGSSTSIANEPSAGTIGCLVMDSSRELFALSNNHVFAMNNYADLGIPVIAPGQIDIAANALDPFVLGHLAGAMPIIGGNPQIVNASANIDAAVIKIRDASLISSMQRDCYDTPNQVGDLKAGIPVEKVGRTTGRTRGQVVSHHVTPQPIKCNIHKYGTFKVAYFTEFFGVVGDNGAFSTSGDSGSLVTTIDDHGQRLAVGLVFAGNDDLSFVLSLDKVLDHFGLQMVGGHNIQ